MGLYSSQGTQGALLQAPKKEQLSSEASDSASGSESGSDAGSEEEPAQRTPAALPKVQQAAKAKPVPQQTTAAAPVLAAKVAAKTSPKPAPVGIRARLQQSAAAAAAAAKDADSQPKASPRADEVVSPLVQVAASQPEPLLAPSVSPRLPYDSADVVALPTRSSAELPYSSADLTASRDPDAAVQQSVFTEYPGDSTGRNESAGVDADFFAAGTAASAAAAAEETGMPNAPMGTKANKGLCA